MAATTYNPYIKANHSVEEAENDFLVYLFLRIIEFDDACSAAQDELPWEEDNFVYDIANKLGGDVYHTEIQLKNKLIGRINWYKKNRWYTPVYFCREELQDEYKTVGDLFTKYIRKRVESCGEAFYDYDGDDEAMDEYIEELLENLQDPVKDPVKKEQPKDS